MNDMQQKNPNLFFTRSLYQREMMGKLPVHNTIALWHLLPKDELLDRLLNCKVEVLRIVAKTPVLYEKLTFNERFRILCRYEPFAKAIYNNDNLLSLLDGYFLALLGCHHYKIAEKILTNKTLNKKLNKWDLVLLGRHDFQIAKLILGDLGYVDEICGDINALGSLGEYNLDISNYILNENELYSRLDEYNLFLLCKNNIGIIPEVLKLQECYSDFFCYLSDLGSKNFQIAKMIFEQYKEYLIEHQGLMELGENHIQIANWILKDQECIKTLTRAELAKLGKNDFENAKLILKNPGFKTLLNGAVLGELGQKKIEIAKFILKNQKYCDALDGCGLAELGKESLEIAHLIFNRQDLIEKLDGLNLATLGQNNFKIASIILNDLNLCKKLTNYNLAYLGTKNVDIAHFILNRSDLCIQLDSWDLFEIAKHNIETAMCILNRSDLLNKLEDVLFLINDFHPNSPVIGELILKKSECPVDVPPIIEKLKCNALLYQSLIERLSLSRMVHQTCLEVLDFKEELTHSPCKI